MRTKYFRICVDCGDKKEVTSKRDADKSTRCIPCSKIKKAENKEYPPFIRICKTCEKEISLSTKPSSDDLDCKSCSIKKTNEKNKLRNKEERKRNGGRDEAGNYVRNCPDCGKEIITISRPRKPDSRCSPCHLKHINSNTIERKPYKKRKKTDKPKPKPKSKKVYKEVGTDGAEHNKVTIKPKKEKKDVFAIDEKRDNDMIKNFFKNGGKVTKIN